MRNLLSVALVALVMSLLCACAANPSSIKSPILGASDASDDSFKTEQLIFQMENDEAISFCSRVCNDGIFALSPTERQKFVDKLDNLTTHVEEVKVVRPKFS